MAMPAKLSLKIGAEILGSYRKSIKKAQRQMLVFNEKVKRSVNDAAGGAAKGFKNVIRNDAFQAAAVGAAALGTGLTRAVKTAADFQSQMLNVKALSQANTAEFKKLTAQAKELGRTTQFSASSAADAMAFLAQSGFTTSQILDSTGHMLSLAAASGLELGDAANIASNVLKGMGLEVKDTNRVIDVLAQAAAAGNVTVETLGETFKYVAPIASKAGASIEDMAAAAAVLGNSGIKASQAGTSLNKIIGRMAAPPAEAAKAFDKLGVSTLDARGNLRPYEEILLDMDKAMGRLNLGTGERLELQKAIFSQTANAAGATLQEAAANGELAAMTEKMVGAQGSAAEMAKTKMSGLEGSMKRLASAGEALAIAFGTPLLGPIAAVAEVLAAIAAPIGVLLTEMPVLGVVAGIAIAALVGFVVILPIIAAVQGAMIALGISAGGMWAALFGPVGLTIAAIIGVIAILQLLYNNVEPFRKFVDGMVNEIKYGFKMMVTNVKKLWNEIQWGIKQVKKFFSGGMKEVATNVAKSVLGFIASFALLPLKIFEFVAKIIGHFTGIDLFAAGSDALTTMWEGFKSMWPKIKDWLVNGFKNAMGAVGNALNPMNWPIFGGGKEDAPSTATPGASSMAGRHKGGRRARALGGPISAGRTYLVGERGPELFSSDQSGRMLSNSRTMGALSMAPTINISVANSNASPEDIAAAVARGLDDALMEAEAGVRALLND